MRRNSRRLAIRCFLAQILVLAMAAGCARATETVTEPDVLVVADTDGALSVATATEVLEPTQTPEPWPSGEPYPAALSVERAAEVVLGWLDPGREPRIEWTSVVRREDLAQAWGQEALVDAANPGRQVYTVHDLPKVMVAVLASTRGIVQQDGLERTVMISPCYGLSEDGRERVFVAFDPADGRIVLAEVVYAELAGPVATVAALPEVPTVVALPELVEVPTVAAQPTATFAAPTAPAPVEPPEGTVQLAAESVPEALRDTFRDWPLLPGNRWAWRVATRVEGLRWHVAVVTETVEAGWVVDDATALVRSRLEVVPVTESGPSEVSPGTVWRYVTPLGAFSSMAYAKDEEMLGELQLAGEDGGAALGAPVEPLHAPLHAGPAASAPSLVEDVSEDVEVQTAAGTFRGCTRYSVRGGRGWGTYRWMCPGTGHVRAETHTCNPWVGTVTESDLIAAELIATID